MGWLVALPMLAALYVINKRLNVRKPKLVEIVSVITMLVAAGAGCGLAYTFIGDWIANLVSLFQHMSSDYYVRIGIALCFVVVFTGIALLDIVCDREADKAAQFAAIVMPTLLLLVIGGVMHKSGGGGVESAKSQLATFWLHVGGK